MATLLAIVVGVLYGVGLYLVLRRSLVQVVVGLGLLGHAANLLIFVSAELTRGRPPLVPESGVAPVGVADPLPQALILTAIVISFGVLAFALSLVRRAWQATGSDDIDELRATES